MADARPDTTTAVPGSTGPQTAKTYPFERGCPIDPPAEFAWLREHAPVSRVTLANGAQAWLATRHEDVRTVLADERFSRRRVREEPAKRQGGSFDFGMSIADPADHARWRRLVAKAVTPKLAESMRARIGELVDAALDRMAEQAQPVDLMSAFAYELPIDVICALFDVPLDLRGRFGEWATTLRGAGASMSAFGEAMGILHGCAVELVARKRGEPGDGVLGALLDVRNEDGVGLSDEEITSTILLLTVAGYETSAVQLGNGFFALFRHPRELKRLEEGAVPIDVAVEEILRYAQAGTGFAGTTYTTTDVELGGTTIPADSAVFISLDSAGRDESQVDDPDTFDLARGSARHHLSFGSGRHFCLGAPIARVELQEAFSRVLRRFPGLRLATDIEDVTFGRNLFSYYPKELLVRW